MREADRPEPGRRRLLTGGLAAVGLALVPREVIATPTEAEAAIRDVFGDRLVKPGRVTLSIPPISENGYSVPLTVEADSPMTAEDHVSRILVFAEANPLPDVARFELGPRAGRARIQTRSRLGGTQKIRAIAEMSDGSLWGTEAFSIVTLAACVV